LLLSSLWFQIASQHPILYHPQSKLFTEDYRTTFTPNIYG